MKKSFLFFALFLTGCVKQYPQMPVTFVPCHPAQMTDEVAKDNRTPQQQISAYVSNVRSEIMNHIQEGEQFNGKRCSLKVKISRAGLLESVSSAGGDPALCQAAITATAQVQFNSPPTQQVWDAVKDMNIEFNFENSQVDDLFGNLSSGKNAPH